MFYLLDHPNPYGSKFYTSRRSRIQYAVIHTAENLPDVTPPDRGAEAVARYFSQTSRNVSAHETVDSDSYVRLLPDRYTAWHARGFNSNGWGLEICTKGHMWDDLRDEYVQDVIRLAAARTRRVVDRYGIPVRRVKPGQGPGLIAHADIDPTRRTDPGRNFPWDMFMAYIEGKQPSAPRGEGDDEMFPKYGDKSEAVKYYQRLLVIIFGLDTDDFPVDGDYGPKTKAVLQKLGYHGDSITSWVKKEIDRLYIISEIKRNS